MEKSFKERLQEKITLQTSVVQRLQQDKAHLLAEINGLDSRINVLQSNIRDMQSQIRDQEFRDRKTKKVRNL